MKKATKIPVHYFTEITGAVNAEGIGENCYITNQGGKQYLVEVLA